MKARTKKVNWKHFWEGAGVVGLIAGLGGVIFLICYGISKIEPDRSYCTNYPKAYSKAVSAEYVDGIGCIITDINNEKMPRDAFDRKYYP